MNVVLRDTVNDFSLIGRYEVFESNIHDTRLMHEQLMNSDRD